MPRALGGSGARRSCGRPCASVARRPRPSCSGSPGSSAGPSSAPRRRHLPLPHPGADAVGLPRATSRSSAGARAPGVTCAAGSTRSASSTRCRARGPRRSTRLDPSSGAIRRRRARRGGPRPSAAARRSARRERRHRRSARHAAAHHRLEHVGQEHAAARDRAQHRARAGGRAASARRRFAMPPVDLQTSIRVQDSLELGLSYFMAALARLKQIVDAAEHESRGPSAC